MKSFSIAILLLVLSAGNSAFAQSVSHAARSQRPNIIFIPAIEQIMKQQHLPSALFPLKILDLTSR